MRLCLLLFLLLFLPRLEAQTFRAALLGGGNFSQIEGDDLNGYHQFGWNAGIRTVAVLGERWRVGPEIIFSQSGSRRQQSSINFSPFDRIDLTMLEVPLMVYYKDWRFLAEAGLSYQRLFDFRVISDAGFDITATTDLNENLLAFKAGVTFLATEKVGINFRYSHHLSNIDVDNALADSFKGQWITLRLVYTLGRGETLPRPVDPE